MADTDMFRLYNDEEYLNNMFGDYTYLTDGYYKSMDCELSELKVRPTTEEALDAYVVPLAMRKAALNNIQIPECEIITDKLIPPVLAYPVNPFSSKFEVITEREDLNKKLKTLTMSGKYAVICQKLPDDYRIDVIRCFLGMSLEEEYNEFAMNIFRVFKLPLMKIRAIVTADKYLFSAIEPLLYEELTLKEKKKIEEMGTWQG